MELPLLKQLLFNRFTVVLVCCACVSTLMLGRLMERLDREGFKHGLQDKTALARDLLEEQQRTDATLDWKAACQRLSRLLGARVTVFDGDGSVLGDSLGGAGLLTSGTELETALAGRFGYSVDTGRGESFMLHQVAVPLKEGREVRQVVRLSSVEALPDHGWTVVLPAVVVPLALAWFGYLLFMIASKREREEQAVELTSRIVRFGDGEYEVQASHPSLPELAALAGAFDRMATVTGSKIRALELEKRQWEALFTGMREGIVAVDDDFNMLTMNQAARVFLGLADDEKVDGKPLFMAVRNANLNHFIHELFKSRDDHREEELEIRAAAGGTCTYQLNGVRFEYIVGRPPGALVVLHDITRIKRLEDMRSEFVANVSHELKTPLTSIKGFVETLESCLPEDDADGRRFAGIIVEQADRLNAIIDDLLTLSRLEQADHWVARDYQSQEIRETIDGAVRLCGARIKERQVELTVEIPATRLYANHRLLEQALVNLLENAVKYSPEGSKVELRVVEEPSHLAISVEDHGVGIPREHQKRVFERFHRVDKSRDRQTGGTGLGLSIVRHIVRVHGGTIDLQSKVGTGSTFTIRLPRRQAERKR